MSDEPYPDEPPAQPPQRQVRAVLAVVGLLFLAIAVWGVVSLKDQLGGSGTPVAAGSTTRVTTVTTPTPLPTTAATPSIQIATPVPSTPEPSTPSTPSSTTSTTTTKPPVDLPGGARVCDGSGEVRVASGTPRTSCSFAFAVRDAWVAAGRGDTTIRAHSTVTDQDYSMTCAGSPLTTCRGGNRAVVYLY